MMRHAVIVLTALTLAAPAFAKEHSDTYPVACSELWPAVKDVVKNSGSYVVVSMDNTEMMASYTVGAVRHRTNSVHLNTQGSGCEMVVQSTYRGINHDDATDFKNRVDESLAKLKAASPAAPAKPPDEKK
jgi:hypothetical protein